MSAMKQQWRRSAAAGMAMAAVIMAGASAAAEDEPRLPRPEPNIPDNPPLHPQVITDAGQRLLLSQADVTVRYDTDADRLIAAPAGWWIINYPLDRIEGLDESDPDAIAQRLFDHDASELRNWYVRSGGSAPAEPEAATGPAPIAPTAEPTLIVDVNHDNADDNNIGTPDAPLRTIQTAFDRAVAGDVIHVMPGTYRESVLIGDRLRHDGAVASTHGEPGTADAPIVIEGIRDEAGNMPVITGNDPFPDDAWRPTDWPGVYRADLFTDQLGTVSFNGEALREANAPHELAPREYHLNRASRQLLERHFDPAGMDPPHADDTHEGHAWRQVDVDDEGYLDLRDVYGDEASEAVVWASVWLWLEPDDETRWNPDFPEPIERQVEVDGSFRAARMPGSSMGAQANKYRVWVDGELVPAITYEGATAPRASWMYGFSDRWRNFPLREGWNHVMLQIDTTTSAHASHGRIEDDLRVRIRPGEAVSVAHPPADRSAAPEDREPTDHIAQYMLWGPVPGDGPDMGVYVRLPDDADPNDHDLDLAARGSELLTIRNPFTHVRGFDIRHGAQYQQRGQVNISGEGSLLEGCIIRNSEWLGIRVSAAAPDHDVTSAPLVLRDNWILDVGDTGIGGSGRHERETPVEALNYPYPGNLPLIIEHNTIVDYGRRGVYGAMDGGMKLFNLKHAVIRYNTTHGGFSHYGGIWLDWGHYNNRLEGNLSVDGRGSGLSVEASPGPHLLANNVVIGLRPGATWFRAAILVWDSDHVWSVNNTIDGQWDDTPGWQNYTGTEGIAKTNPTRRSHSWGEVTALDHRYYNNLILGTARAMRLRDDRGHVGEANYTDRGRGAEPLEPSPRFVRRIDTDYRLSPGHPAERMGVDNTYTELVRHDFHGLLRFDDDGRSIGAFRAYRGVPDEGVSEIEIEYDDGTMQRLTPP